MCQKCKYHDCSTVVLTLWSGPMRCNIVKSRASEGGDSPSLISLIISVDVKNHVYLPTLERVQWLIPDRGMLKIVFSVIQNTDIA